MGAGSRGGDREPTVEVTAFERGGRAERTGIALVHEGEEIRPAPGSEAAIGPAPGRVDNGQAVHLYFPVEVHVSGAIPEAELRDLEQRLWEALDSALS